MNGPASQPAGPGQLTARVQRILALHWRLLGDWFDRVEPVAGLPLPSSLTAAARIEYFEAALMRNPSADVDELVTPPHLVPSFADLFLGGWRPSAGADRESYRVAARWERGAGAPERDILAPIIAEWQAAHA